MKTYDMPLMIVCFVAFFICGYMFGHIEGEKCAAESPESVQKPLPRKPSPFLRLPVEEPGEYGYQGIAPRGGKVR